MRVLRLVFAWCFAAVAALCLWQARVLSQAGVNALDPGHPLITALKTVLVAGSLLLAVLFVVAGFAVLKHARSANTLAIAANLAAVLYGGLALRFLPAQLSWPAWIAVCFGLVGLAVFAFSVPSKRREVKSRPYARVPGDGTNPILNRLVLVAGIAGGTGGVRLLALWAVKHGLPRNFPPFFVLEMVLAILVVLAIHEAGHALAGIAAGMKLTGFVVGPFFCLKSYGRWNFTFRSAGLVAFSGHTMVAPASMSNFRIRKAIQVAAGPAASLIAGFAATETIFHAGGKPWAGEWEILAVFVTISSLVGLLNLIPFGNKTMYSDGAKLYQLLSGGLWAQYHCALGLVSATTVTPLRPRDYDIATLDRAAANIAQGNDELFVYLCEYNYYLDSGRMADAAAAIERAEACVRDWSLDPSPESAAVLVFGHAFVRRDAAAARRWWERMEAKKTYQFTDALLDVRCALAMSENRFEEAEADWKKAEAWTHGLPATGQAEVKRNAVRLLRQALDEALAAREAQFQPAAKH